MSDKFSSASEKIRNSYSQAREKVGETYSSARDRMEQIDYDDLLENLRTYVRSNPGKALLISVGTGFLIGLLLRRAGEEEDDD